MNRRAFVQFACAAGLPAFGARGAPKTDIRFALESQWLADSHEHTLPEAQRLRTKMDVLTLMSHYAVNDVTAAGLRGKARAEMSSTDIPLIERWRPIAPYWEKARNTGFARAFRIAIRDLYNAEELSERTCEEISARIQAANTPGVHDRILRGKSRIRLIVLDDYYNVEPRPPESSLFVTSRRFERFLSVSARDDLEKLGRTTLDGLERALDEDFERNRKLKSMAAVKVAAAYWRPIFFERVTRAEASADFEALARGRDERDSYSRLTAPRAKKLQDYLLHRLLRLAGDSRFPVQFHTGIHSGGNYFPNSNPALLVNLFTQYQDVSFVLFHAGYPYLSETAALAKNYRNVYVDMSWMHIISPSASRRALHEYIETIPVNKIFGFGGDYRWADLTYGHSVIARQNVIRVLQEKVAEGYFSEREAIDTGRLLLHDNVAEFYRRSKSMS